MSVERLFTFGQSLESAIAVDTIPPQVKNSAVFLGGLDE